VDFRFVLGSMGSIFATMCRSDVMFVRVLNGGKKWLGNGVVFLLSLSPAGPQPNVVTNTASGALVGGETCSSLRLKMTSTREGWVGGGVCRWKWVWMETPRTKKQVEPALDDQGGGLQRPAPCRTACSAQLPTPERVRQPVPERDGWLVARVVEVPKYFFA
jgi:hypothetical protein